MVALEKFLLKMTFLSQNYLIWKGFKNDFFSWKILSFLPPKSFLPREKKHNPSPKHASAFLSWEMCLFFPQLRIPPKNIFFSVAPNQTIFLIALSVNNEILKFFFYMKWNATLFSHLKKKNFSTPKKFHKYIPFLTKI